MYQLSINPEEVGWSPLDFPGVSIRILFRHEQTGATTVMTRMDSGAEIPAHFHTHADETVFVLQGDFIEDGEPYQQGSFFVGKAGTVHGPHRSKAGCVLLTTFSADLDFQIV